LASQPLVSVIIPIYNGEKFLQSTLESVFAQTYSNIEVIVVDDGSTDNSSSIAKSFPDVRYIGQKNMGVSTARNRGIEFAAGDYIALLDADDLWDPKKIELQISYMEQNPDIDMTGTKTKNFLDLGTILPVWLQKNENWELVEYINSSSIVARRNVFKTVGKFDETLPSGEDTDWFWRAKEAGITSIVLENVMVKRRFHGNNLSWKYMRERKERLLQIARKSVQRKSDNTTE